MVVLFTCKNQEDTLKNESARVLTRLSVVFFSDTQGQLTPQSVGEFRKIRTHASFYGCPRYLQDKEYPIKNEGSRVLTRFSPL